MKTDADNHSASASDAAGSFGNFVAAPRRADPDLVMELQAILANAQNDCAQHTLNTVPEFEHELDKYITLANTFLGYLQNYTHALKQCNTQGFGISHEMLRAIQQDITLQCDKVRTKKDELQTDLLSLKQQVQNDTASTCLNAACTEYQQITKECEQFLEASAKYAEEHLPFKVKPQEANSACSAQADTTSLPADRASSSSAAAVDEPGFGGAKVSFTLRVEIPAEELTPEETITLLKPANIGWLYR